MSGKERIFPSVGKHLVIRLMPIHSPPRQPPHRSGPGSARTTVLCTSHDPSQGSPISTSMARIRSESSSTLASASPLVQYCINTCPAVDAVQSTTRYSGARSPISGVEKILEKRPARRETSIRWPDRFQGNYCIRMANGPASGI